MRSLLGLGGSRGDGLWSVALRGPRMTLPPSVLPGLWTGNRGRAVERRLVTARLIGPLAESSLPL